jgi:integrase
MQKVVIPTLSTDRELRALRPTEKRQEYRDAEIRNLRVRVMPSGLISFALLVRPERGGNVSRRRLGDYGFIRDGSFKQGRLSLKDARRLATSWNAKFQSGIDPKAEERAAAEKRRIEKQTGIKFAALANDYLARKVVGADSKNPKMRRAQEVDKQIEYFVNAWSNRPIRSLTADDIELLLEAKAEKHPAMARNLFATLRAMLNWAGRKKQYRPFPNPCDGVDTEILGTKSSRKRTLSHDELRLLMRNVRRMPRPFGTLYTLLLLSGLRLNEAARATWSEFDWHEKVWVIPGARMKGKQAHAVPLTPDILETIKRISRPKRAKFVLSTTGGKSPVSGFSKVKAKLTARMDRSLQALRRQRGERRSVSMVPWTNHDIRRTFRTELSAMGSAIDHEVKEALLAHIKQGIVGTYDQYQYLTEKRDALCLWESRLKTILAQPIGDLEKFVKYQ